MSQKRKNKSIISCSFEVIGDKVNKTIDASFIVSQKPPRVDIVTEGEASVGVKGVITNNVGGLNLPVENVDIYAFKNGVLYDSAKSKSDGSYILYLENGTYDFELKGQSYSRTIRNYEVTNGIKPFRKMISGGQIKEKQFDTTLYYTYSVAGREIIGEIIILVQGRIVDSYNEPIENVEIVVADSDSPNKIIAFIKTKKDGKFAFILGREDYDIVIRSPYHSAKSVEGCSFIHSEGFLNGVLNRNIRFDKDGEWVWTLN